MEEILSGWGSEAYKHYCLLKMLSKKTLAGQEVGGALVPEDTGYILQLAVNRLLSGVKTKQATRFFARQNTSTASPLGSRA
jgi:hypothetical protein